MNKTKGATQNPIISVCGKRTVDYIAECLAMFNRGANLLTLRTTSGSESTGVEVAHIMNEHFSVEVCPIALRVIEIEGVPTSSLEIPLKCGTALIGAGIEDYAPEEGFVKFIVYHLLVDSLLYDKGKLGVFDRQGGPLISISKANFGYVCESQTNDRDTLNYLTSAYYRCGLLLSPSWGRVATVLSRVDDVILGIDTNILYNATISEHLFSSLTIVDPRKYVHTPNWLFIVIPSTVMHEIEQAANYRDRKNRLEPAGRMGFRALQEILELDENADLSGLAISIVGEASPMLDTKVELQGLRKDLFARRKETEQNTLVWLSPEYGGARVKMSTGDTIIRDQFRHFLRTLSFHKGGYFLTADKSHAVLARAEGLLALYYRTPPWYSARGVIKLPEVPAKPEALKLAVPIGKLIYELAVQFGSILVRWDSDEIEIGCDAGGETLDHWVHRELRFDRGHLRRLLKVYSAVGRFAIEHVVRVYDEVNKLIEEPEF